MNEYTLIIDTEIIFKTNAKNLLDFHKKIIPELPGLLHFPHFWNLVYDSKLPNTIVEKIIYFSKI